MLNLFKSARANANTAIAKAIKAAIAMQETMQNFNQRFESINNHLILFISERLTTLPQHRKLLSRLPTQKIK